MNQRSILQISRPARGIVFLLLVVLFGHAPAAAQIAEEMRRIGGRTYVIAYPDTTQNTIDDRYPNPMADTIAMFIYSPVATEVTITGNGYLNTVQVQAGIFSEVYLNSQGNKAANPIVTQSNIESRNVFRVEADDPVIVYCYICTKFGAAAWTPLPVETWGLEYYAAANEQEIIQDVARGGSSDYRSKNKAAPAEVCVISAYDNTTVTIVPSLRQRNDNLPDWVGFPNLTVTLAADRAYQVQGFIDTLTANYGNPQPDLAGVYVYADKPIGMVSGNTRAQLNPYENAGLARNSFKDLMIEAIAPLDQHGKQFVYTPTMDDRVLTGQPGELTAEKRTGEIVRVYGTSLGRTKGSYKGNSPIDSITFTVENGTTHDSRIGAPAARYYRTDTPAQAYKSTMSVVKNLGASSSAASYQSWGTFMVEMVPREQWGTFAPFIAPTHPDSMMHYVNVVTDTSSRFFIYDENNSLLSGWRDIPGTDLCWTTRSVPPGITKYFKAIDTLTRFHAYLYGLRPGKESFQTAGGARYEERLATAYGYPIAPRRDVLRAPDSLAIRTRRDCDSMTIDITAFNVPKPIGLRSISLSDNSVNTRLRFISPLRQSDVAGAGSAKVKVEVIDNLTDARGEVVIVERTGRERRVDFAVHLRPLLELSASGELSYGLVNVGGCIDTVLTLVNRENYPIELHEISLADASVTAFTIIAPTPLPTSAKPLVIPAGQTLQIKVRLCPQEMNKVYNNILVLKYECAAATLNLHAQSSNQSGVEWSSVVEGAVSIRPTPAHDQAQVSFRLRHSGDVGLALVDPRGAEVYSGSWVLAAGAATLPIDVSSLPSGVYYCRLTVSGATQTLPLTVVR